MTHLWTSDSPEHCLHNKHVFLIKMLTLKINKLKHLFHTTGE